MKWTQTNIVDQDLSRGRYIITNFHQCQVPWMIKRSHRGRLEMMKVHQISISLDELKKVQNAFQIDQKENEEERDEVEISTKKNSKLNQRINQVIIKIIHPFS